MCSKKTSAPNDFLPLTDPTAAANQHQSFLNSTTQVWLLNVRFP